MTAGSPQPPSAAYPAHLPPGWMSSEELAWLAKSAAGHRVAVEVGVYMGRTTKVLAATVGADLPAKGGPGKVYAVDNWYGEPRSNVGAVGDSLERAFRRNLEGEIASGKVIVYSMRSVAAADALRTLGPSFAPDMIFIDSDHEYPQPLYDIMAWRATLAPGGLLCGHDSGLPGVRRSLDEAPVEWNLAAGSIWQVPVAG